MFILDFRAEATDATFIDAAKVARQHKKPKSLQLADSLVVVSSKCVLFSLVMKLQCTHTLFFRPSIRLSVRSPVRQTPISEQQQQLDKNHLTEVDREQGGLMNQILRLLAIAPSCRDVSASLSEAAAASLWQPSSRNAQCCYMHT